MRAPFYVALVAAALHPGVNYLLVDAFGVIHSPIRPHVCAVLSHNLAMLACCGVAFAALAEQRRSGLLYRFTTKEFSHFWLLAGMGYLGAALAVSVSNGVQLAGLWVCILVVKVCPQPGCKAQVARLVRMAACAKGRADASSCGVRAGAEAVLDSLEIQLFARVGPVLQVSSAERIDDDGVDCKRGVPLSQCDPAPRSWQAQPRCAGVRMDPPRWDALRRWR